jgi:YD repeat-containing protein
LKSEEEINYFGNDSIITNTQYQYNSKYRLPIEKTFIEKVNKEYKTKIKYPFDFTSDVYGKMTRMNLISPMVESKEYIKKSTNDFLLLNTVFNNYTIYTLGSENIDTIPLVSYQSSSIADEPLTIEVEYLKYDKLSRPIYMILKDGTKIVYLWDSMYNNLLAEIRNTSFENVMQNLGLTLSGNPIDVFQFETKMTEINNLRGLLSNAAITTYTYFPFIGLDSKIDVRGVKTTYNYDTFGRLQTVKDENDKTIENYDYHYKD